MWLDVINYLSLTIHKLNCCRKALINIQAPVKAKFVQILPLQYLQYIHGKQPLHYYTIYEMIEGGT